MNRQLPVLLDLSGRLCIVVGGGKVAERKLHSLIETLADVTVISPEVTPRIEEMFRLSRIQWEKRKYMADDLVNAFLVIAATDDEEVNLQISRDARDAQCLVNVADQPQRCDFILPSTLRRGKLVISVATSGASPGLARKIRTKLDAEYGPEYESYLDFLADAREIVQNRVGSENDRRKIFHKLLDKDFFQNISQNEQNHAYQRLNDMIDEMEGREQGHNRKTDEEGDV